VVGLAQRRSRSGAWFHGAAYLHWDPARLLALLELSVAERRPPRSISSGGRGGVGPEPQSGHHPIARDAVIQSWWTPCPNRP